MPIVHVQNQYLIARGRVYFDPFNDSEELTGEMALGNCPGVNITISSEKWEHFSSEEALREKDGGGVIQVDRTGQLICDNFSPANAALWLSGTQESKSQTATPVTGEMRTVKVGRQYQLGATSVNPLGVRNVTGVAVWSTGGSPAALTAGTDYNVDAETGRVQILGGAISDDDSVEFRYTPVAATFESVKSGAKAELTGALRIVSNNATGGNRDWYLPKVSLAPEGDLALIAEGTDVVQMTFSLEVLKSANAEAIYCDGRPVAV